MTAATRKLSGRESAAEAAVAASDALKRPARPFDKAASRVDIEHHPSDPRITWRRAAYRAVLDYVRAAKLVGVLPAVTDKRTLQTSVGNAWIRAETGLGDRSVAYGLANLSDAGLIAVEAVGPRRIITLLVPEKPAHAVRGTDEA